MERKKDIWELIERFRTVLKYSSQRGGTNLPEMFIICGLSEAEKEGRRICVSEVADALSISKSAASQMIDKLAERGILCKYRADNNKKTVYIRLTDEATEMSEIKKRKYVELISTLSERMGEDMDELIRLNSKFVDILENVLKEIGN